MKFLANENIPVTTVKSLDEMGFDIISVGSDFAGITDKEVIEFADKEERTIITFDRDYGELIFKQGFKPKAGVIYLRLPLFGPQELAGKLSNIFNSRHIDFYNAFTVIDKDSIRKRKY